MSGEAISTELLSGRTGVIVTFSHDITAEQALALRHELEQRYPGVTFAVVSNCSGVAAFTFEPDLS